MKNNKLVFLISFLLLFLIGLNITLNFNNILFSNSKKIFFITWTLSYLLLILEMLFFPLSYTTHSNPKTFNKNSCINAIIPVYNENPVALKKTIYSILEQSYPINHIFIVDDGSKKDLEKFYHPKVTWLRHKNSGKRYSQALAIKHMDKNSVDYILTVDSDSILEKNALKKMMCQFNTDNSIVAITGFVLTDNFRDNLLTRIIDLNIAMSCIVSRPIRSYFGALETTSGALSIYQKDIIFDNIEDYVTSGTYSDDRQLCFYSAQKGRVIALTDLIVNSNMPNNLNQLLKQRLRWAKGSWIFFTKQMKYLSFSKKIFPLISMVQTLLILLLITFILKSIYYKHYIYIYYYFLIRLLIRLCQAFIYIGNEQRMTFFEKIITLLFIAPLEILFTMFILSPIKYLSLFYLKDTKWLTR